MGKQVVLHQWIDYQILFRHWVCTYIWHNNKIITSLCLSNWIIYFGMCVRSCITANISISNAVIIYLIYLYMYMRSWITANIFKQLNIALYFSCLCMNMRWWIDETVFTLLIQNYFIYLWMHIRGWITVNILIISQSFIRW